MWHENAIFYELYLRAFSDANSDGQGDLQGLQTRLDYLQWLGVDCIWLQPLFASPLRDDGYDVSSYYDIHPDYGTLSDFSAVVDAIHARGMRVIIDLVMNHTSDQHAWFQAARRSRQSRYHNYYLWRDDDQGYPDATIVFPEIKTSNWTKNERTGEYYWHRFYPHQPDLNYRNPEVQEEMIKAFRYWLDMGVDGYRLDAVTYLYEREGTNCESLPETHAFLKQLRAIIEADYPHAIMLAESNQRPRDLLPYFGASDEMHLCFNFPLMPQLYVALAQQDAQPVIDVLAQTPALPGGCQWATFLRNHDELTLEMVTPAERELLRAVYLTDERQVFNGGIARRLAPLMGGDSRKIELMHALLLALPGTPVLYYGDEIGMGDDASIQHLRTPRGVVQHDPRMGVRLPMAWDASAGGGFSSASSNQWYAPLPADGAFSAAQVNVAARMDDENSLLHRVRGLILARKRLPVLAKGAFEPLPNVPRGTLCFLRRGKTNEAPVCALHNLTDAPISIDLPAGSWRDAFTGASAGGSVQLGAYGYWWGAV